MAIDGKAADFLCVADPIKETTRKARAELKKEGIKVVMLTGDNRTTAEFFAQSLVIEQVYA